MREDAGRCHRRDAVPRPPKRRTERKMMTTDLESASLDLHAGAPAGKIAMHVTKPIGDERDLSLSYSPGVAAPVRAIAADPAASLGYTNRPNPVAGVTNGPATLGLGNPPPEERRVGKECVHT